MGRIAAAAAITAGSALNSFGSSWRPTQKPSAETLITPAPAPSATQAAR